MQLAAKFGRPILTLIDTPGAYRDRCGRTGPGQAIARIFERWPAAGAGDRHGDGRRCSGGALAIAVGDRVNILENVFIR